MMVMRTVTKSEYVIISLVLKRNWRSPYGYSIWDRKKIGKGGGRREK
jgi:hypothetical protein